ncbi:hypothetical protein IM792_16115 [Mucilaginibacter sp. JRF]|uniref:hypothetical protein n=1 Tax=Mucilaginibacter sp. JRF TaxID=2780088 RepID=UPI0018804947|nr:hypothetical protein [Mucilaginibacter sp. JRF]MBE9585980.1 hypothetical protein [Mucilaginibacter sp. JRF]
MKNLIIFIFLVLLCNATKAQNCLTEKDEQTGESIKLASTSLITDSLKRPTVLSFIKRVDRNFIRIVFWSDVDSTAINSGSFKLSIGFTNGENKVFTIDNGRLLKRGQGTLVRLRSVLTPTELLYFRQNAIIYITATQVEGNQILLTIQPSSEQAAIIMASPKCLDD